MLMVLIITLLALLVTKLQVTASPVEIAHGRVHMAILDTQNFVCQTEPFQTPFTSDDIAVHLSPARPGGSLPEYQSSTVWVDHVTRYNFTICLRPSAKINFARRVDVHWLAYLYKPSSGMSGVAYIPMWTAGTKCVLITYSERVTAIPTVFVTVAHEGRVGRGNDASTVWTEDVTVEDFKLCLRELKNFDGAHREIKVNWLVLSALPAEWVKARLTGILTFPNTLTPPEKFIYSYCQEFPFPKQYFTVPTMIASPSHRNNIYSSRNVWPKHNAITYWIESIDTLNYTVCVKDLQPYRVHHDPILVNFLVFGDLHPCLTVNCGNHASCQAYSSSDVRCECPKSCPVYQEEYCANDGKTYSNMCEYDQMVCNTGNEIKLHPGSCEAFVLKHGRVAVMLDR
ncbi:uncharacterized protein LOC116614912 [Nematostella vectensis]|uniref:uncharacterized protein LOC116614912 n=1 Tax=Nematostella vectensis TaxID=45351 RepID=UPI0020777227|nr:uncharacterized protein LOC116614912 [Nematostella vectensis]XP_032232382.2 uncharacterized protein LOC116614912 [Nematostella vectensis]